MSRRTAPARGLTYIQANGDRLTKTTIDDEIYKSYRLIEAEFPELECLCDHETQEHVIIEKCGDGVQRLFKSWPWSQGFHIDLVRKWLLTSQGVDPLDEVDKHNKKVHKAHDYRQMQKVLAAGEKLAFAFAQDGLTVRPRMAPLSTKLKRKHTLPNHEVRR